MNSWILNESQRAVQEAAKDFSRAVVSPKSAEIDASGRFPQEIIDQLSQMGFMGMMVPEEYGGAGMDTVCYVAALEAISAGCASTGVVMSVNNSLVCAPLLMFGTEAQKKKYLVPLAKGERLGCFALSEPGNGSDAAALKTTARRDGNDFVLSGTKNFITNGREASVAIVFASLDVTKGSKSVAAFIVDSQTKGYSVGKLEHKLGINGSSTAQIHFDEVRVPAENLLGSEGQGFKIAMATLDGGRIGIAAQALGIASAAIESSKAFARTREAFGAPIARLQGIQWHIADMVSRYEGARLLSWSAAVKKDQGERYTKEAAMAKLVASEMAMWVTTKAIQVHGGYGYCKEYPVERHFRDAKITEIYEGTSEIQRIVIGSLELNS